MTPVKTCVARKSAIIRVIAPQDFAADAVCAAAGQIPIVLVAPDAPTAPNMHSVIVDQAAGVELAVALLADLGHRNIVHVRRLTDWFVARSRITGWRESQLASRSPGTFRLWDSTTLRVLAMRTLQILLAPAGRPAPLNNRIRPTLIVRESSAQRLG